MPDLVPPVVAADALTGIDQPTLVAGHLTLRPWLPDDADVVVAAYQDPDIQRWHLVTKTQDEARVWISSWRPRWSAGTAAMWAITDAGPVVGRMGLRNIDCFDGWGEVAYWVMPAARRRGVAVLALEAVTCWATVQLGLHRLELSHSVRNPASCRVAVGAGYQLEGTRRSQALHADGWHDTHLHARVA